MLDQRLKILYCKFNLIWHILTRSCPPFNFSQCGHRSPMFEEQSAILTYHRADFFDLRPHDDQRLNRNFAFYVSATGKTPDPINFIYQPDAAT